MLSFSSFSFASEDTSRHHVSNIAIQPFLVKHFDGGWYAGTPDNPQTYDFRTENWTTQIGPRVGRVMKFGAQPVNLFASAYYNTEDNDDEHLRLNVLGKTYSLLINFTSLEDERGNPLGFVLVFDNLTKLEKMQRMAAWREVARRIAHEIKNPLTPIQLSAQRLRRRYPEILTEKNNVFDQCTRTIITQVDELKQLVSEFSQFARMPKRLWNGKKK